MIKAFQRIKYSFSLNPLKHDVEARVYKGKFWAIINDLDLIYDSDNISAWCRENCRGRFTINYYTPTSSSQSSRTAYFSLVKRFKVPTNLADPNGIFVVGFSNKTDASMFRLTFSDLYTES